MEPTRARPIMPIFAIAFSLLLVALTGPVVAQPGQGGPPAHAGAGGGSDRCLPGNAYENEDYRIWFHGEKFQLKVFEKNGTEQVKLYQYKSFRLTELDDSNGTAAWMNLERASSTVTECATTESDGTFLNLTLQVTDTVYDGSGHPVGDAVVTYEFHFNQSSAAAKFDLLVEEWPWQSDGELAYSFDVETDLNIETAMNGMGFRDDDGEARGFIEWAPNATATYEDGHQEEAIVNSQVDEDVGGDTDARASLRFTNATAGYIELDYDPWLGVGPYIIVAGLLLIGTGDLPDVVHGAVDAVHPLLPAISLPLTGASAPSPPPLIGPVVPPEVLAPDDGPFDGGRLVGATGLV